MSSRRAVDPAEMRSACVAVLPWLEQGAEVERSQVASAVRLSLRTLERVAPGRSVEVRVPPWGVIQCVEGPQHTRGTPPNVVETDPRTWLLLVIGAMTWSDALDEGALTASGLRADISDWLPLVRLSDRAGPAGGRQERR